MTTTLDPSLAVRGRILAALKADAQLTAIVPASRIYPSKSPASPIWPFLRLGSLTSTPLRLDGGHGAEVSGMVHNFTKASSTVLDPEALSMTINSHVARILDAIDTDEAGGLSLGMAIGVGQVIEDSAEADAYHGFVPVNVTAS